MNSQPNAEDSLKMFRNSRVVDDGVKAAAHMREIVHRMEGVLRSGETLAPMELLRRIVPADGENYRSLMHSELTGRFAGMIGERLGLDTALLEKAGIFHDAGRLANVHRYFRNDRIGTFLLDRLHMRADIEHVLQPENSYVHPERFRSIDAFTPEQRVIVLADICGKRKDDGSIQSFAETLAYHRASRAPAAIETPWPSEREARSVLSADVVEQWARVYEDLRDWAKGKGADIDEIRGCIETAERNSPLDTVIFDIGGVLIGDSDPAIIRDFCATLDLTPESLLTAWDGIVGSLQNGSLTEDGFWAEFEQRIGRSVNTSDRDLFNRSFDTRVDPQMDDLVRRLKAAGKKVMALSDTIPPHARALREAGVYEGFDEVLLSPEIRCSKKAGSAYQKNSDLAAFCVAALRAGLPSKGCVFIDDKAVYAQRARQSGMKGIVFSTPEALVEDLGREGVL